MATWVRIKPEAPVGENELVRADAVVGVRTDASGNVYVREADGDWQLAHEFSEGTLAFQKLFAALDLGDAV